MTITQTVEIPDSRRLTIDVPREVPTVPVILTFTPAASQRSEKTDDGLDFEGDCPICAKLRDPETGALPYNAKVLAAMEESKAMMCGEIPAKWYKSIEEAREDLGL